MPRQIQPQPLYLRKASIENIVRHFEDFWCAGSTSDLLTYSRQWDCFTHFQYLCDDMIQDIIDMLNRRELLRPHHFQILLHSNIRRLRLTRIFRWFKLSERFHVQNDIINMLGVRCQKLAYLNLEGLDLVEPALICILMAHLPRIVSLGLHSIRLDDYVIKAISENCHNLLELDITCCGDLSDNSLLFLCNCPEHCIARPKLRKLSIRGLNDVLKDTVVHLLQNQTCWQILGSCGLLSHAFDQMYGEEFRSSTEVPPERSHNLLDITIAGISCENVNLGEADRLDLTFQCCPLVRKLSLHDLRKGTSLISVGKLKHLKSLSVHVHTRYHFSTYMAILLSTIGDNLTHLRLSRFEEVGLILIGKSCPNLETLELDDVGLMPEEHTIDDVIDTFPYFTNLSVFSIHLTGHDNLTDIDENVLCSLLQNATKLVRLRCTNVIHLNDNVMTEANRKHGFRHLRECSFDNCSSIAVDSMWMLLCHENPLETLTVRSCKYITRQDVIRSYQEAKRRRFIINIKFGV